MAQSSEIKLNKRFDQNIEVTGTIKIGVREQTSAGDYVSNKLTLIPPYHTGGPFNIRTRDDATNAFISIAYGSNEVATIKHDGTIKIGSNTVIHTGNIGSYALTNFDITSQTDPKYLRSDTSDSTSGTITVNGGLLRVRDDAGNIASLRLSEDTASDHFILEYDGTGSGPTNYVHMYSNTTGWAAKGSSFNMQPSTGDINIGATNFGYKFRVDGTSYFAGAITTNSSIEITNADGENAFTLSGASPTIAFKDVTTDADDFYIHVNSNNFYILTDRGGTGGYNDWETPHPLQLEADTNVGYLFGNTMITTANIGSHALTSLPAHNHDASNITSGTIADARLSSSVVMQRGGIIGTTTDWDTYVTNGVYGVASAAGAQFTGNGRPVTSGGIEPDYRYGLLVVTEYNGYGIQQTYYPHNGTRIFVRTGWSNASWLPWHLVWTDRSDGSGSGLDADLLDGLQGSSFLRSNVNDTFTGTLTLNHSTFGAGLILHRNHSSNAASLTFKNNGGQAGILYATYADTTLRWRDGTTENAHVIWHSGNDGSSSGLDADTVDGYHASSFFIDGDLTLNMSNDDGLVYNDTNNIMYVKADGSQYPILDSRGGTVNGTITAAGGINMNNTNISGVNHITINDSGAGEGIEWIGGSGWKIYESGNNLDNTSGNLQFVTGSTRRMTLNTSGILEVFGNSIEINGKYARDFKNYKWISGGGSYYSSSAQGWTKVAEAVISGNCSGNVMYGRMYMRNYHEVQMYDIAVVTRGECDFTTNNESHFIEIGCTAVAGSQFIDYKDHIRAVLVQSSTNLRKYEIQFYETPWNDNWWELWTSGFTIYDTPQAPGSSTGTPQIRYQSRMSADTLWADNSMYAPQYYDRDNTAYYLDPHVSSNLAKLILNGTGTGNAATLKVNNSSSSTWNHSIEAFAANMTAGENNLIMTGKQGSDRNAGYMGFHWEANSNNNNFVGIGLWNYDNLFRVYPDQITGESSFRAPIFYDKDNTGYYLNPDGTSNLNNLTVVNTIQARVKSVADTGYGDTDLTFYQDSGAWGGAPAGWHSHIVCNHGNGSNYYNQIIHMPFWGPPTYSRLEGGTQRANYSFWTSERTIISEHDITGPMFYVRPASNGAGAKINFSDHSSGSYAQNGTLEYVHSDTASYGSGNAFKFYGTEGSMSFHVAGKGLFTGDVVAYYSDMRLKTKIGNIQDPIGKIKALSGFYYEPNEKALEYGYEKERRIGLSAQEVQEVVPEAVTMAAIGDNYLSVDYAKLVPVLVEAIKELSNKVEELENKLNGTEL